MDYISNYNIIIKTRGNEANLGENILIGIEVFNISFLKSYKNMR
jgi:hypothetical protein